MATPRELDPKFRTVPAPEVAPGEATVTDADREGEGPKGGYIANVRKWTDDKGVQHQETDRMPMSEWAAYEKEWGI